MNEQAKQTAADPKSVVHIEDAGIRGVFSKQVVNTVGTGTTKRKSISKVYFYVDQNAKGELEFQAINKQMVPSGPVKTFTKQDILDSFKPELEFYTEKVYPQIRAKEKGLARAERHRSKGESFSAEMEFDKVLTMDEKSVRANFGVGLCYMERGELDKADDIFNRILGLNAAFEPKHKHLFNEFGINLRKNEMFDQAVEYYTKALTVTEDDENLLYNLARAYFHQEKYADCREVLDKCLSINANMDPALKMLSHLDKKGL